MDRKKELAESQANYSALLVLHKRIGEALDEAGRELAEMDKEEEPLSILERCHILFGGFIIKTLYGQ